MTTRYKWRNAEHTAVTDKEDGDRGIPVDHRFYKEVVAWVEDGNEIEAYETAEDLAAKAVSEERQWRDSELGGYIDHFQKLLPWNAITTAQQNSVKAYRDALLAYPNGAGFPDNARPIRPSSPSL